MRIGYTLAAVAVVAVGALVLLAARYIGLPG